MMLDHHSVVGESKASQNTWIKDISEKHELLILGDKKMPNEINSFEVYKPLETENRASITEKIVKSFEYTLGKSWDYIIRLDTDVYCNVKNLIDFLKFNNKKIPLYCGQGIHFPNSTHPCYLSNPESPHPTNPYYYFAQGGCYVLSRDALEKSLDYMFYPAPLESEAEDIVVGIATKKAGINLQDRPDLFNCGYEGWGWGPEDCDIRNHTTQEHIDKIKSNYISTHKVTAQQIYEIHNSLMHRNDCGN